MLSPRFGAEDQGPGHAIAASAPCRQRAPAFEEARTPGERGERKEERKAFFFWRKRSKKTLSACPATGAGLFRDESFLVLFFKKEHSSFLP